MLGKILLAIIFPAGSLLFAPIADNEVNFTLNILKVLISFGLNLISACNAQRCLTLDGKNEDGILFFFEGSK